MTTTGIQDLRLAELVAFLSGELDGRMGLRSSLGPMLDGTSTAHRVDGPSDHALEAARTVNRIEAALRLLARGHADVLVAAYCSRDPQTPTGAGMHGPDGLRAAFRPTAQVRSAQIAAVAALLEGREHGESVQFGEERLRTLLRARAAAQPDERRALGQQLTYVRARALRALDAAHGAYLIAVERTRLDHVERRREPVAWPS